MTRKVVNLLYGRKKTAEQQKTCVLVAELYTFHNHACASQHHCTESPQRRWLAYFYSTLLTVVCTVTWCHKRLTKPFPHALYEAYYVYVHAYLVNCVGPFQLILVNFQDIFLHRCQHEEWTVPNKVCTMVSSTMVKNMFLKEGFSMGTLDLVWRVL